MRKFLMFSRTDTSVSVAHALQNAILLGHGRFEVPAGHDPIWVLPSDPRFVYIEAGLGTVYHYDTEVYAIQPYSLGLPMLLLGPEIDAAARGRNIVTLRVTPQIDDHPKRDRIVYDTFAAAYFGTPGGISFEDVKAGRPLYLEVNRKRLIKMLARVVETAVSHPEISLGGLLHGIALDPRAPREPTNYKGATRAFEAALA